MDYLRWENLPSIEERYRDVDIVATKDGDKCMYTCMYMFSYICVYDAYICYIYMVDLGERQLLLENPQQHLDEEVDPSGTV